MANDIYFNTEIRNCPLTASGDFELNTNPSAQNGAIILQGRVVNLQQPQIGIGFNSQIQGGPKTEAVFQLNRCVNQIQSDGGQAAWVELPNTPNVDFDFELKVAYQ